MLCKEVLEKYQKLVPFPISLKKIATAGYDVGQYLKDLGESLRQCDDVNDHPLARTVCAMVDDLKDMQ